MIVYVILFQYYKVFIVIVIIIIITQNQLRQEVSHIRCSVRNLELSWREITAHLA